MGIQKYKSGIKNDKTKNADSAVSSSSATAVAGGTSNGILYQSSPGVTTTTSAGLVDQVLVSNQTVSPSWKKVPTENIFPESSLFVTFPSGGVSEGTSNFVSTSTNGIIWTTRSSSGMPNNSITDWTYGKGRILLVTGGNDHAYSEDGVNWTTTSNFNWGVTGYYYKTTTYANGKFYVVLGNNGSYIYSSTNGVSFTQSFLPIGTMWRKIAYGNGTFVIVAGSASSSTLTSTDAVIWTTRTGPWSNWLNLRFLNGIFIGTRNTSQAQLARSTDGITWDTSRNFPSSTFWNQLAYGNGIYVALADYGTAAAYSTDSLTWTQSTMPTASTWASLEFNEGVFVATGPGITQVYTSTDGITWTPRTIGNTGYANGRVAALPKIRDQREVSGLATEAITAPEYTVGPYDKWINLAAITNNTQITLPNPALNRNREIVIKNTTAMLISSTSSNVKPLTSQNAGSIILNGAGKFARLVSDGSHWIVMEAN